MAFLDFLKVQKQGLESLASVGVIGMHMVSGPLVGVAIGYFLDDWLDTGPWLKLIFLFIGIGAGFLNVYIDTKMYMERLNRQRMLSEPNATNAAEKQEKAEAPEATASKDSNG